jgi:hypothetical protein
MTMRMRAALLFLGLLPGVGRAECVDYGASVHWIGATDTPGYTERCVVAGYLLLVADGYAGLQLVDISNPAAPRIAGSVLTPGRARDVAAAGRFAYVVDEFAGLQVVDISNPTAPRIVGSFATRGAVGVAVQGPYAYLTKGLAGLLVLDVSTPELPRLAGGLDSVVGAGRIAVAGVRAFVTRVGGLAVLDITEPASPQLWSSVPQWCNDVAAFGPFPCVAASTEGLILFDVSDPALPRRIGTVRVDPYATSVAVAGSRAYVSAGYAVQVVDLADPTAPTVIATVGLRDFTFGIAAGDDLVCATTGETGVQMIRGGNSAPHMLARAPIYSISRVALAGPYACTCGDLGGLDVVDPSDPRHPVVLGHSAEISWCTDLVVDGHFAFLAGYVEGFRVVDLSDPAAPTAVAMLRTLGSVRDVALAGPYAFAASDSGLGIIDISVPSAPEVVALVDTLPAQSVGIVDHYAYVDFRDAMLGIIDVANPRAPIPVRFLPLEFVPGDLAVSGSVAYAPDRNGLRVLDVSDPTRPVSVSAVSTPGPVTALHVVGNTIYAAAGNSGLLVLDATIARAPRLVGATDTFGYSSGLAATADYVYVAESGFGLDVFPTHCGPSTPVSVTDLEALPGDRGLYLRWRALGDAPLGFEVRRALGARPDMRNSELLGTGRQVRGRTWEYLDSEAEPGTTYTYGVAVRGADGQAAIASTVVATARTSNFSLHPAEPNPARIQSLLRYDLARPGLVRLDVYDVAGRHIRSLHAGPRPPGRNAALWDGRDGSGRAVANGLYVVRLRAGDRTAMTRVLFLR